MWPPLWLLRPSGGDVNRIGKPETRLGRNFSRGRGEVSPEREEGGVLEKEECCDGWSGRNGVRERRGVSGSGGVRCLGARGAAEGCGASGSDGSAGLFSVRFMVFVVFTVEVERLKSEVLRVGRWDLVGNSGLGFMGVVVCWF